MPTAAAGVAGWSVAVGLAFRAGTATAAATAAASYAKKNPEQTAKYVDQAAQFVDKQTKGKYSGHISGATQKVKSVAGIDRPGTDPAANGHVTT